jgi:hypothetical protein
MAVICSYCDKPAVEHHCADDHTDCCWIVCRACGVIVDWRNDRAVDKHGKPLKL